MTTPLDELRATLERLSREHPTLVSPESQRRLDEALAPSEATVADWIRIVREADSTAHCSRIESALVSLSQLCSPAEARAHLALATAAHEQRLAILGVPGATWRRDAALRSAWRWAGMR